MRRRRGELVGRPRSRIRDEARRFWIGPQIEGVRVAAVERASGHNYDFDGAGEPSHRLPRVLLEYAAEAVVIDPVEQAFECSHVLRALAAGHDHTGILDAARHGHRDLRRPLVEQFHEFGARASGLVAPQHRPTIGLSEREANADLIPDFSDLPLQDVRNPERIADFDRIQVGTANEESCAARTDEEAVKSRQVEDELVRQTLGKKTLDLTAVESCQRLLEALTCSCSSGCERPRTTFDHLASFRVLPVPILSRRKCIMPVSGEQRKPTGCASRWHPVQNRPAAD